MNRFFLFGIALGLLLYSQLNSNELIPYYANNKWGFSDINHNLIIKPKYDRVDVFYSNLAWVEKNGKCGFIDRNGTEVIPIQYESAENFYDEYSVVSNNGKYGVIDKQGNYIIPLNKDYISSFDGYSGKILDDSYNYGLIGENGKYTLEPKYPHLEEFGSDKYIFADYIKEGSYKLGKMGVINNRGEVLIERSYDKIQPLPGGFAKISLGRKYGLIDTALHVIAEPIYSGIRNPKPNGFYAFKENGKWGIKKITGETTAEAKFSSLGGGDSFFDEAMESNNAFFSIKKNGKHGLIDAYGNEIVPPVYYMMSMTKNGITPAYKRLDTNKTGLPTIGLTFLDSAGKELIEPTTKYNMVGIYSEGLITVGSGNNFRKSYHFVNLKDELAFPGEFEESSEFKNGYAIVKRSGKYGVINKSGIEVIPCVYSKISHADFGENLFIVKNGRNKLYFDSKGKCFCK